MGAVSGGSLLKLPGRTGDAGIPDSPLFDVESFRSLTTRRAEVRDVPSPTLVLGSTQPEETADRGTLARRHVTLVRRRSGGGAVYLAPTEQLWVDVWVPRSDELWDDDVVAAAAWVGAWWAGALQRVGLRQLEVHAGPARPGAFGKRVCFAGLGPGEVHHAGRKLVGLSQWRSRQGALFSTARIGAGTPRRWSSCSSPAWRAVGSMPRSSRWPSG